MKKYILEYDFMGERVSKPFDSLFEFMEWLAKIEEDDHIVNSSIDFKTEIVEP